MKYVHLTIVTLSAVLASLVLYAAFDHNPMGAFCRDEILEPCNIDYAYASVIWLSWFLPPLLLLEGTLMVVMLLKRFVASRRSSIG